MVEEHIILSVDLIMLLVEMGVEETVLHLVHRDLDLELHFLEWIIVEVGVVLVHLLVLKVVVVNQLVEEFVLLNILIGHRDA